MVAGFNRSFSLPGSPRFRAQRSSEKSYHVRSISLPCRSHPFISQLGDEIRSVKNWQSTRLESDCSSWLCDGLCRLELLHASLNDLINLPQNQDSLRRGRGSEWTGRFLDDFLRFADAHGCFMSELVAMNEHQSEAQVALRRNDAVKLRSIKKTEKELTKLASSLRAVPKSPIATRLANGIEEAELAAAIRECQRDSVGIDGCFLGGSAVSSTTSFVKNSWTPLRRLSPSSSLKGLGEEGEDCRKSTMEKLEVLEECVRAVESRSERLFRSLVNTRVSLLNITSTC